MPVRISVEIIISGQGWVAANSEVEAAHASEATEKVFCHSERSEESLCRPAVDRREILRFAQNDKNIGFFCGLFGLWEFGLATP
jgi:hypothetical protein